MYKIYVGDTLVYDTTNKDMYPVGSPSLKLAINDAGSLDFTLYPGHPFYNNAKTAIHSSVRVLRDNEEIFYGRLLTYQKTFTGELQLYAEGAGTFFLDSEMPKASYNETVSAFLNRCVTAHNSQVENWKKFTVRTVRSDIASTQGKFDISGWTQTKSVLESQLLSQYGGFFIISSDGNGGHYIDYLAVGSLVNNELIKIGENVINKDDKMSGENIFTALRPIGSNDTVNLNNTSQSSVQISNCTLTGGVLYLNDLINKYGKIVHTETFSGIDNATALLREAEQFITKRRTNLPSVCDVNFVDFHYLNPDLPYLFLGNRFTNIEGFSGTAMTATDLTLDLEDPANDELTLKNDEEMENDNPSSKGRNASSISSKSRSGRGGLSGLGGKTYKYITESENQLTLNTKEIMIAAEERLQLSSKVTYLTGHNLYLLATQTDPQDPAKIQIGVYNKLNDGTSGSNALFTFDNVSIKSSDVSGKRKFGTTEVDEITGSQFWANRNSIVALNGKMYVGRDGKVHVISGSGMMADRGQASYGLYDENNLTAGILISKINDQSTAKIKADNIELDGEVIVGTVDGRKALKAGVAKFESVWCGDILTDEVNTDELWCEMAQIDLLTIGNHQRNVGDAVYDLRIVAPSSGSNTYTLQKKAIDGNSWEDVGNFSRATTLSGVWSGRNFTVTASPQGETTTGIVYNGLVPSGSVGKSGKNVYRDYIVYSDDGENNADQEIMRHRVTISASSVYDDGHTDGYSEGSPASATIGSKITGTTYNLSVKRADGTTVGKTVNASGPYNDGKAAATVTYTISDAASLPSGETATSVKTGYLKKVEIKKNGTLYDTIYFKGVT